MRELTQDDAANIVRALDSEGGKLIQEWVDDRLSVLQSRILAGLGDISIEEVRTESVGGKGKRVDVTVLSMVKDPDRTEARALGLLKSKFSDWRKMVG